MARPCRPSYPSLAVTDDEIIPPSDDPSIAFATSTRMQYACSSLRFHVDNRVWDVILKEVMDWRDSSWTSVNLPRNRTAITLCLSCWDAQEPVGPANDDPLRKRILAQMISVQLLASCFTPPHEMNTLTLPSGWYHRKNETDDDWLSTRLVSSLRQHTQWKHSPAFGHQARNNSAASMWPERDDALSREALLAEKVSLNRRLRQKENRIAKKTLETKGRRQSKISEEQPKRRRLFRSRHQPRLRKSEEPVASYKILQGLVAPRPKTSSPRSRVEQKNVLKVMSGLRVRTVGDGRHRWSLEPVLRSESHSVFVQPVKEFVMKRWNVFRLRSRNPSSISASSEGNGKGPEYQRAASSTSRDSIQLSRRSQIMTMVQGSGTSLGQPASDAEASSGEAAGRERMVTSAETSQDSTNHARIIATSTPLIAIGLSDGDLPIENTDHFPSTAWVPRQSLQQTESGQARNRTSTSGTTVYSPPLIAEASPNSKRLESDGSTSPGT